MNWSWLTTYSWKPFIHGHWLKVSWFDDAKILTELAAFSIWFKFQANMSIATGFTLLMEDAQLITHHLRVFSHQTEGHCWHWGPAQVLPERHRCVSEEVGGHKDESIWRHEFWDVNDLVKVDKRDFLPPGSAVKHSWVQTVCELMLQHVMLKYGDMISQAEICINEMFKAQTTLRLHKVVATTIIKQAQARPKILLKGDKTAC